MSRNPRGESAEISAPPPRTILCHSEALAPLSRGAAGAKSLNEKSRRSLGRSPEKSISTSLFDLDFYWSDATYANLQEIQAVEIGAMTQTPEGRLTCYRR